MRVAATLPAAHHALLLVRVVAGREPITKEARRWCRRSGRGSERKQQATTVEINRSQRVYSHGGHWLGMRVLTACGVGFTASTFLERLRQGQVERLAMVANSIKTR